VTAAFGAGVAVGALVAGAALAPELAVLAQATRVTPAMSVGIARRKATRMTTSDEVDLSALRSSAREG
jgi:hypothetical protein